MNKPKIENKTPKPPKPHEITPVAAKTVNYIIYAFLGTLALAGFVWALGLFLKGLKAILIFVGVM